MTQIKKPITAIKQNAIEEASIFKAIYSEQIKPIEREAYKRAILKNLKLFISRKKSKIINCFKNFFSNPWFCKYLILLLALFVTIFLLFHEEKLTNENAEEVKIMREAQIKENEISASESLSGYDSEKGIFLKLSPKVKLTKPKEKKSL